MLHPSAADASVRPASPGDADAIGAVHARAWRGAYRDLLPPAVLAGLTAAPLAAAWRSAITAPPSSRHHVLVAASGSTVVGFAATAPSGDRDAREEEDGELVALAVDPAHQRAGHGSRLLSAAVATLREDGFTRISTWSPVSDRPRTAFLTSAGMVLDGARRSLPLPDGDSTGSPDAGPPGPAPDAWVEVRLAAAIGEPLDRGPAPRP